MRKPRLIRPVYFLWMFVPVFLYVAVLLFGLPHMVWDYRWRGGAHYGDFAGRHYTFCRYVGVYGVFAHHPSDGRCPFVRWYHPKS